MLILVVDDDEVTLAAIQHTLQLDGHEVVTATNGRAARSLEQWIVRATTSLPVPLSPKSKTGSSSTAAWAMRFATARIDSNITMVVLLSLGVPEDADLLAPYTEIAADRLVAVAADGVPEDVAAPLPTSTPSVRVPIPRAPATLEDFYADAPGILRD